MRRPKVLIVDDEEAIVMGLVRVLYQDNEKYDVLMAGSGEIGQQILRENRVDVMVTDVRLPGMSGLDLLCWASTESPSTRAIVITAFDLEGVAEQAYRFGCLRIVQKPFDLHRLRLRVLSALEGRDSFSGNLSALSPADVIQMLCLSQKTTALRVVKGNACGLVHIEEGRVIHASWDDLMGEDAFYAVLRASGGVFNTLDLPENTPRTIDADWQFLLLEGMRLEDEEERASHQPGPPATPAPRRERRSERPRKRIEEAEVELEDLGRTGPSTVDQLARLIDQGFVGLRSGDYAVARQHWEEALRLAPNNRAIELNLRKLQMLEKKQG